MKKMKATVYSMGSMLLCVGALLCASGIENSANGWVQLAWTMAALGLGGVALVLAALGVATEQPEKSGKVHREPENTVRPHSGRKVG